MYNNYKKIVERLKDNQVVALETTLHGAAGRIRDGLSRRVTAATPTVDARGRRTAVVTHSLENSILTIGEPFLPRERLILLGGGHIAVPVADFGARCGFYVCVVDDRPEFADQERFPSADEVICSSYENAISRLCISPFDYVVIITRGHRFDADCLRTILSGTIPAYLGMIGSRRRVRAQMEQFKNEGFDSACLARVCTPIGLNIGAVTPEEIAISILAEVIAYRRLAEYSTPDRFCVNTDAELSVLEHLADSHEPMAVATVIEATGSSPRGAGAKMAVHPDGRIVGSVGGGLGEAAVIQEALKLIGTGRYRLLDLDLTGDVLQDDAMACGGEICVLIEDF